MSGLPQSCKWRIASANLLCSTLAIDSKLRGCDVVAARVDDVAPSGYAINRATIRQKKSGRPVGSSHAYCFVVSSFGSAA
jgi:hypothetical protein